MINVKEAVKIALSHVGDLFAQEQISNLGLEEVELNGENNRWLITVGFSRPWDYKNSPLATIMNQPGIARRAYKIVSLDADTGDVISVLSREPASQSS